MSNSEALYRRAAAKLGLRLWSITTGGRTLRVLARDKRDALRVANIAPSKSVSVEPIQ